MYTVIISRTCSRLYIIQTNNIFYQLFFSCWADWWQYECSNRTFSSLTFQMHSIIDVTPDDLHCDIFQCVFQMVISYSRQIKLIERFSRISHVKFIKKKIINWNWFIRFSSFLFEFSSKFSWLSSYIPTEFQTCWCWGVGFKLPLFQ